jgi:hypothetical protein
VSDNRDVLAFLFLDGLPLGLLFVVLFVVGCLWVGGVLR